MDLSKMEARKVTVVVLALVQVDVLAARFEIADWISFGHLQALQFCPARLTSVSSDNASKKSQISSGHNPTSEHTDQRPKATPSAPAIREMAAGCGAVRLR